MLIRKSVITASGVGYLKVGQPVDRTISPNWTVTMVTDSPSRSVPA